METKSITQPEPLLTVPDVQRLLSYQHPGSIRRLFQRGDLPGIKLNERTLRFRRRDVEAFIAAGAVRTGPIAIASGTSAAIVEGRADR